MHALPCDEGLARRGTSTLRKLTVMIGSGRLTDRQTCRPHAMALPTGDATGRRTVLDLFAEAPVRQERPRSVGASMPS